MTRGGRWRQRPNSRQLQNLKSSQRAERWGETKKVPDHFDNLSSQLSSSHTHPPLSLSLVHTHRHFMRMEWYPFREKITENLWETLVWIRKGLFLERKVDLSRKWEGRTGDSDMTATTFTDPHRWEREQVSLSRDTPGGTLHTSRSPCVASGAVYRWRDNTEGVNCLLVSCLSDRSYWEVDFVGKHCS